VYERIVVALDGSAMAEQILPYVEALAEKFASSLTLMRAIMPIEKVAALVEPAIGGVPLDPSLIEDTVESEEHEATTYLEHVANDLRLRGLTVNVEIPQGSAVDTILECARQTQADLIALTTHGRSGLQRLVYGSVADGVVRQATSPVLLVRVRWGTDAAG
jgi:nucleotide-binding universal stress UspA family protein